MEKLIFLPLCCLWPLSQSFAGFQSNRYVYPASKPRDILLLTIKTVVLQ